jgi:class 3 adenylate cyclase
LAAIENISKMATEEPSSMASAGIGTPAPIQAERRQVTILFADIVGYTKMTSEVDAE